MAAPGYTTDLATLTTSDTNTGFSEPTNYTVGLTPATEADYFIQGAGCVSKNQPSTGLAGIGFTGSAPINVPVDGAVMQWMIFSAPNSLAAQSAGGMVSLIGSDSANFRVFYVRGSDTYTYGGWNCIPCHPSGGVGGVDSTVGAPTKTQYFGMGVNCPTTAPTKGQPQGIDVIRWGRCQAIMSGGDAGSGYCALSGFAAVNDATGSRWGLIQRVAGGYQWQGQMLLGSGTQPVDFRDNNSSVLVLDTRKVSAIFNTIEVQNTASRVDMTAISWQALGTGSRGRWVTTNNATINLTNCTFTDMSTFQFQASSTLTNDVFRRCDTVTQSGSTISQCTFDTSYASMSLISDVPNLVSNCTFASDGDNHAMQIVTAGSCTFVGHKFTGYIAGTAGTGSVTGTNATVYNTSGGKVTISVTSGDVPSVRNSGSSTSEVITGQKTLTLSGLVSGSEVRIFSGSNPATAVQLAGVETSTTTFPYTYTYTADFPVNIVIFNVSYLPIYQAYTVGSTDATLPIQQVTDRQYFNPP